MKIKELYNCEYATPEGTLEELYPLQKWYNQLIDKTIQEINREDVAKMLRQEMFPDLAITKAIEFLREDPFAGELYEGEILAAIAKQKASLLASYTRELQDVLSDVPQKMAAHEWLYDGEEEELREIVDAVACKTADS